MTLYNSVFMAVFNAELQAMRGPLTADGYEMIIRLAHGVATLAVKVKP